MKEVASTLVPKSDTKMFSERNAFMHTPLSKKIEDLRPHTKALLESLVELPLSAQVDITLRCTASFNRPLDGYGHYGTFLDAPTGAGKTMMALIGALQTLILALRIDEEVPRIVPIFCPLSLGSQWQKITQRLVPAATSEFPEFEFEALFNPTFAPPADKKIRFIVLSDKNKARGTMLMALQIPSKSRLADMAVWRAGNPDDIVAHYTTTKNHDYAAAVIATVFEPVKAVVVAICDEAHLRNDWGKQFGINVITVLYVTATVNEDYMFARREKPYRVTYAIDKHLAAALRVALTAQLKDTVLIEFTHTLMSPLFLTSDQAARALVKGTHAVSLLAERLLESCSYQGVVPVIEGTLDLPKFISELQEHLTSIRAHLTAGQMMYRRFEAPTNELLADLETFKNQKSEMCAICMEDVDDMPLLSCCLRRRVCKLCHEIAVSGMKRCPMCRREVTATNELSTTTTFVTPPPPPVTVTTACPIETLRNCLTAASEEFEIVVPNILERLDACAALRPSGLSVLLVTPSHGITERMSMFLRACNNTYAEELCFKGTVQAATEEGPKKRRLITSNGQRKVLNRFSAGKGFRLLYTEQSSYRNSTTDGLDFADLDGVIFIASHASRGSQRHQTEGRLTRLSRGRADPLFMVNLECQ